MDVFYREWDRRAPGETRDLGRARALAGLLGLLEPGVPVLTVVGSKGKGTAATYASAFLGAAGLRVCTVTSPALRSDRERIRIDGKAVSAEELAMLGDALDRAVAGPPPPSDGYLSPSGLFTLGGVLHAARSRADAIVLEAGMGGRSDEVALFPPDVAAVTPIFREHAGVLGETVPEIAAEKLGVAALGRVSCRRRSPPRSPASSPERRSSNPAPRASPPDSCLPVWDARRRHSASWPRAAFPEPPNHRPRTCGRCCPP
ncbi:hypothetical protein [Actinomadura madurae]|uniref:hypothetical protein n=1 Tax=Actinomadura madurae TaxID=1993 RepID=UPI0027E23C7D|nr:hypothetical protein [Actinomadura madurae]